MPLIHSSSKPALRRNMETLHADIGRSPHVQSRAQAIAIALNTQREAKKKGRKSGGRAHFDAGGFANPNAAPVSGPPMPSTGIAPMAAPAPAPAAAPTLAPVQTTPAAIPAPATPSFGAPGMTGGMGGLGSWNFGNYGHAQWPGMTSPQTGMNWQSPSMGFTGMGSMTGVQASKDGGGIQGYALGGPPMPWFSRQESKQMMHTGPVNSIVPGRTDRHSINVPSGAYVLPAATISHLGQSNTNAGMAVAHRMFGTGPFGSPAPKMGRGMGLPKPPRPMGISSDRGGGRGHDHGAPTPVVVAGGEYIIHPAKVAEIGGGSVDNGHRILDEFVKRIHKKHAKEIASLPPPAKS